VQDVEHKYGSRLQHAMMTYIARNMHRVPASVRERWADPQALTFCAVHLANPKYSFIHWHHQGTIEFRCFGNVQNATDAETCLTLAIEALRYGYRCQARMEPWPQERIDTLLEDISGRVPEAA
jgi:hypothetical protein